MTIAIVLGMLFCLSEALAYIPSVKANSIFQAIQNVLASLNGKNPDGTPKV